LYLYQSLFEEFHINPLVVIKPLTYVFEQSSDFVLTDTKLPSIAKPNGKLDAGFIAILAKGI
jgi:hypothetical protein